MNPADQSDSTQRWQNSAAYWEKYRALITQFFAPLTAALIKEARITAGQNILDIGGGSGEPSLTISTVVGPTGSVMFSDPAPAMVEAAKTEANRRDLKNIRFTQCAGDDLPFDDGAFDAVIGRFSAMFFANPGQAAREALRVVRPAREVSFAVWGAENANPFLSSVNEVVERFIPDTEDDADAPDAFRYADPGKFADILRNAGGESVNESLLDFRIQASISFEQFWQVRTEMSDMLRQKLAQLSATQLAAVKQELLGATRDHFRDGTMNFPAKVLIVSARKSAKD